MPTCSVHAVINPEDLMGTVLSKASYAKLSQISTSSSSQETEDNIGQSQTKKKTGSGNTNLKSDVSIKSEATEYDGGIKSSSLSVAKNPKRASKQRKIPKTLLSDAGRVKSGSGIKKNISHQQARKKKTEPQPSSSLGKNHPAAKSGDKAMTKGKQWKMNNAIYKKIFKTKSKKGKAKKTGKCAEEIMKHYTTFLQSNSTAKFMVLPKHDRNTDGVSKSRKNMSEDPTTINIPTAVKSKKKANMSAISSKPNQQQHNQFKLTNGRQQQLDSCTALKVKTKRRNVTIASCEASSNTEGKEFDALERFKRHQRIALDKVKREKSNLS